MSKDGLIMKTTQKIRIQAVKADIAKIKTDLLAVGVSEQKTLSGAAKALDKKLNGAILKARKRPRHCFIHKAKSAPVACS
jgi:hypothetical protein